MPCEPVFRRGLGPLAVLFLASAQAATSLHSAAPSIASPDSTQAEAPAAPAAAPEYRYCPVCGAQNRAENRFCLKDGTPLPPLLPGHRLPGFVRSQGTYSPEEIQQIMQRVSESVVRIRVRTTTTFKYPDAYWK